MIKRNLVIIYEIVDTMIMSDHRAYSAKDFTTYQVTVAQANLLKNDSLVLGNLKTTDSMKNKVVQVT